MTNSVPVCTNGLVSISG
uniref:Uncharacterized protein n=1 Tax=Anguilla anguilla TaxID=7936 RepID=A0A0E9Q4A8_ANGAN